MAPWIVAAAAAAGLILVSCQPTQTQAAPAAAACSAGHASGWHNRRCRCNRHDARGCIHWQCRRV